MKFYLTFGQKYRTEKHPRVGIAHPDGFITIEATSYEHAREIAFSIFGDLWSMLYSEEAFFPSAFPKGELIKIVSSYHINEVNSHER